MCPVGAQLIHANKHLAREKIIYDKANMTKNLILCARELKLYKKGKSSTYWHKK